MAEIEKNVNIAEKIFFVRKNENVKKQTKQAAKLHKNQKNRNENDVGFVDIIAGNGYNRIVFKMSGILSWREMESEITGSVCC